MLQIKTFKLDEADNVNAFISTVRLIENGLQVRDNSIIVLYDSAESFDAKSREVALIQKLSTTEASMLAAEIEKGYYEEYFASLDRNKQRCKVCGDKKHVVRIEKTMQDGKEVENTHTSICTEPIHTLEESQAKNLGNIDSIAAQIYVIRKMLGANTHGMKVFGKVKYDKSIS